MKPRRAILNKRDWEAFRVTIEFLKGRLEERETVDWALRLKPEETVKRLALLEIIDNHSGVKTNEPWRSAWLLIAESWNYSADEENLSHGENEVKIRLNTGERTGSLVEKIVNLVRPRLKLEPFSSVHLAYRKPPKRPKDIGDLFSSSLTSGKILDPGVLKLATLSDKPFLLSLAHTLEATLHEGLDIARRIGWDGEKLSWKIGRLNRVYYVPANQRQQGQDEPDQYNRGLAPSVKLLYEVVSRILEIDLACANEFAGQWKLMDSCVHLRLWAALSHHPHITQADEVADFLLALDDWFFWDVYAYPEIAELRAKRFVEFASHDKTEIINRIRKRPPRNQWPKKAEAHRVKSARLFWALRELRRIEVAGANLTEKDKRWLEEKFDQFPELVQMARIDEGFPESPKARFISPCPDEKYDMLRGIVRLKALEMALSTGRDWNNDPAVGASDWIRQAGNDLKVLADFESTADGGGAYARVWERFGWAHSPIGQRAALSESVFLPEAFRVLKLILKLPIETIRSAIQGVSSWFFSWREQVVEFPEFFGVWFKLWPIAVEVTNAQENLEESARLNTAVKLDDDSEIPELDTLNTPAGKLVRVFVSACPSLEIDNNPFDSNIELYRMRSEIFTTAERSLLIAQHCLIEELPYFLSADNIWTRNNLIIPLMSDSLEAILLWRAVAFRTLFSDVLHIVGDSIPERTTDQRLDRESRRSLVFSLVVECLHAFRETRSPAVQYSQVQQMLRALDNEVRAFAAEAVQRFVRDLSRAENGEQPISAPETLFRFAAKPFLEQVWPQERSLVTPSVSEAFSGLPALTGEAFVEAVSSVERFLVPFNCWSMSDYGFYGLIDDNPTLNGIDNFEKAEAFLRLLDLTVGTAEGAVIPHDLPDALAHVRTVAPSLADSRVFRRLATAARRS